MGQTSTQNLLCFRRSQVKISCICNSKFWVLCENINKYWMYSNRFRKLLRMAIQKSMYQLHLRNPLLTGKMTPSWLSPRRAGSMSITAQWDRCCHPVTFEPMPLWSQLPWGTVSITKCFSYVNSSPWTLQLRHDAVLLQCCLSNMSILWTWQLSLFLFSTWHYDIEMCLELTELVFLKS